MRDPKIVDKEQIILVGFSFFGDPFGVSGDWTAENEIGRLWSRFMAYLEKHHQQLPQIKENTGMYEVHLSTPETLSKGNFDIFVGSEVEHLENVPPELLIKILPATSYAIFSLHGAEITSDWTHSIYHDWLVGSAYELNHHYNFQYYDRRFKGMDNIEDSILDVYVPLKPKAPAR